MKILKVEKNYQGDSFVTTILDEQTNEKIELEFSSFSELETLYSVIENAKIKFALFDREKKKLNEEKFSALLTPGAPFGLVRKLVKEGNIDKNLTVLSKNGFGIVVGSKKSFIVLKSYSNFISSSSLFNLSRQISYWLNKLEYHSEEIFEPKVENSASDIVESTVVAENFVNEIKSETVNVTSSYDYSFIDYLKDLNELIEYGRDIYIPERALSHSLFESIEPEEIKSLINSQILNSFSLEDAVKFTHIKNSLYEKLFNESGIKFIGFFDDSNIFSLYINLVVFIVEPLVFSINGIDYSNVVEKVIQNQNGNIYGEFAKVSGYNTVAKSVNLISEIYDTISSKVADTELSFLKNKISKFLNHGENVQDIIYATVESSNNEFKGAPEKVFNAERFVLTTKLRV